MIRTREHAKSWGGYAAFPTRIVSVDCNWPERSVPEGILERVVEHVNADCEKRLDGIPVVRKYYIRSVERTFGTCPSGRARC